MIKSYSRTQSNIALSWAEAELYSFVTAASEAIGMKSMFRDFGASLEACLQVDASAAIGIAQRKGLGKVRHLDTQALWIQDAVRQRRVHLEKVLGTENPADLMTKHFDQKSIDKNLAKLGCVFIKGRAKTAPRLAEEAAVHHIEEKHKEADAQALGLGKLWSKPYQQAGCWSATAQARLGVTWADELDD